MLLPIYSEGLQRSPWNLTKIQSAAFWKPCSCMCSAGAGFAGEGQQIVAMLMTPANPVIDGITRWFAELLAPCHLCMHGLHAVI